MDQYMAMSIKEIMSRFPAVEQVLDEYGIGCGPCSVGDCLLRDIVKIHNLAPADESALMARIVGIIDPGAKVTIPQSAPPPRPARQEIKYSPPVGKLVDEHKLIKRCIALIPQIAGNIDLESEQDREMVLGVVDFIRNFADRYHHAKEEDILFGYFDPELDILQVMHKEHETGRGHVRSIVEGVENRDKVAVTGHLLAYGELLTEHIKKEDEILYPWMDRNFNTRQVGELFRRFSDVDSKFGDTETNYRQFIESLEEKFCRGRVSGRAVE